LFAEAKTQGSVVGLRHRRWPSCELFGPRRCSGHSGSCGRRRFRSNHDRIWADECFRDGVALVASEPGPGVRSL